MTQNFNRVVTILEANRAVIGHSLSLSQKVVIKINWQWGCSLSSQRRILWSVSTWLTDTGVRGVLAPVKKGAPLNSNYKVTPTLLINQAQLFGSWSCFPKCNETRRAAIHNSHQLPLIVYQRRLNLQVFRRVCVCIGIHEQTPIKYLEQGLSM